MPPVDSSIFSFENYFKDEQAVPYLEPTIHPFTEFTQLAHESSIDAFGGFSVDSYLASHSTVRELSTELQSALARPAPPPPVLRTRGSRPNDIQKLKTSLLSMVPSFHQVNRQFEVRSLIDPDRVVTNFTSSAKIIAGTVVLHKEPSVRSVKCSGDSSVTLTVDSTLTASRWIPGSRFVIDKSLNCFDYSDSTSQQSDSASTVFRLVVRRVQLTQHNGDSSLFFTVRYETLALDPADLFVDMDLSMSHEPDPLPENFDRHWTHHHNVTKHLFEQYHPSEQGQRRAISDISVKREFMMDVLEFNFDSTNRFPIQDTIYLFDNGKNDHIKCNNCYAFLRFGLNVDIRIGFFKINKMMVMVGGEAGFNYELEALKSSGSGTYTMNVTPNKELQTIRFSIMGIPVWIDTQYSFDISTFIDFPMRTQISMRGSYYRRQYMGLNFENNRIQEIQDNNFNKPQISRPRLALSGTGENRIKIDLIPQLRMALWSTANFEFKLYPYLVLNLIAGGTVCPSMAEYNVFFGLDFSAQLLSIIIPEQVPLFGGINLGKVLSLPYPPNPAPRWPLISQRPLGCEGCSGCLRIVELLEPNPVVTGPDNRIHVDPNTRMKFFIRPIELKPSDWDWRIYLKYGHRNAFGDYTHPSNTMKSTSAKSGETHLISYPDAPWLDVAFFERGNDRIVFEEWAQNNFMSNFHLEASHTVSLDCMTCHSTYQTRSEDGKVLVEIRADINNVVQLQSGASFDQTFQVSQRTCHYYEITPINRHSKLVIEIFSHTLGSVSRRFVESGYYYHVYKYEFQGVEPSEDGKYLIEADQVQSVHLEVCAKWDSDSVYNIRRMIDEFEYDFQSVGDVFSSDRISTRQNRHTRILLKSTTTKLKLMSYIALVVEPLSGAPELHCFIIDSSTDIMKDSVVIYANMNTTNHATGYLRIEAPEKEYYIDIIATGNWSPATFILHSLEFGKVLLNKVQIVPSDIPSERLVNFVFDMDRFDTSEVFQTFVNFVKRDGAVGKIWIRRELLVREKLDDSNAIILDKVNELNLPMQLNQFSESIVLKVSGVSSVKITPYIGLQPGILSGLHLITAQNPILDIGDGADAHFVCLHDTRVQSDEMSIRVEAFTKEGLRCTSCMFDIELFIFKIDNQSVSIEHRVYDAVVKSTVGIVERQVSVSSLAASILKTKAQFLNDYKLVIRASHPDKQPNKEFSVRAMFNPVLSLEMDKPLAYSIGQNNMIYFKVPSSLVDNNGLVLRAESQLADTDPDLYLGRFGHKPYRADVNTIQQSSTGIGPTAIISIATGSAATSDDYYVGLTTLSSKSTFTVSAEKLQPGSITITTRDNSSYVHESDVVTSGFEIHLSLLPEEQRWNDQLLYDLDLATLLIDNLNSDTSLVSGWTNIMKPMLQSSIKTSILSSTFNLYIDGQRLVIRVPEISGYDISAVGYEKITLSSVKPEFFDTYDTRNRVVKPLYIKKSAYCNNIQDTSASVCSGRGICLVKNTCMCEPGFEGVNCELKNEGGGTNGEENNGETKANHGWRVRTSLLSMVWITCSVLVFLWFHSS